MTVLASPGYVLLYGIVALLRTKKGRQPYGLRVAPMLVMLLFMQVCTTQTANAQSRTPTVTPSPERATATVTPTRQAPRVPTATATSVPTELAEITQTENITHTIATVNVDRANLRSGAGTDNPVVGTATRGEEHIVIGQNSEGTWLQLKSPDNESRWIAASLVLRREEVVENLGSQSEGAVEAEQQEVVDWNYETLASLLDSPVLTGTVNASTGGAPYYLECQPGTEEECYRIINEAFVAAILEQGKVNSNQIAEAIKKGTRIPFLVHKLNPNAQDKKRSPTPLGKPLELKVRADKSLQMTSFATEAQLSNYIEDLGLMRDPLNGELKNKLGEVVGVWLTVSSSNTYMYYFVDEEGRLNIAKQSYLPSSELFIFLATLSQVQLMFDEGRQKSIVDFVTGLGKDFSTIDNSLVFRNETIHLPNGLERDRFYIPDPSFSTLVQSIFAEDLNGTARRVDETPSTSQSTPTPVISATEITAATATAP